MIIATTSLGSVGPSCGMSPALLSRFMSYRHYEFINSDDLSKKLETEYSPHLGKLILKQILLKLNISSDKEIEKKRVFRCMHMIKRFKDMLEKSKKTES